jgi:hydroxymethylglutaryl-CoA synthase
MLALAAVLDIARPNQKIFMVSYGSGAGSDAFVWETTSELKKIQQVRAKNTLLVADAIRNKAYVDYVQFLKLTHKL